MIRTIILTLLIGSTLSAFLIVPAGITGKEECQTLPAGHIRCYPVWNKPHIAYMIPAVGLSFSGAWILARKIDGTDKTDHAT